MAADCARLLMIVRSKKKQEKCLVFVMASISEVICLPCLRPLCNDMFSFDMLMKCLMATGQNLHSSHGTTTSSRCRILTPPKEEGSRANSDYSCHPAVCAPLVPVSEDADMIYIECVQSASRPS